MSGFRLSVVLPSRSAVQDYKQKLKLDQKINDLMQQITVDTDVEILSSRAKEQLWELANSSVADKDTWDYYTDILEKKVATLHLLRHLFILISNMPLMDLLSHISNDYQLPPFLRRF